MPGATKISLPVAESIGSVSGLVLKPEPCYALMVLAHGAGAGMNHRFMEILAEELFGKGIGTLRFNFPYMENGRKRPDPPAIAEKTAEAALHRAHELFPDLPIIAAGKSFGGRMTSQLLSKKEIPFVRSIVFFGFPLHAAGKPSVERAGHLKNVKTPMLFLQGTRDSLAVMQYMEEVCAGLPSATLMKFDGADHSFRAGKHDVTPELASEASQWIKGGGSKE